MPEVSSCARTQQACVLFCVTWSLLGCGDNDQGARITRGDAGGTSVPDASGGGHPSGLIDSGTRRDGGLLPVPDAGPGADKLSIKPDMTTLTLDAPSGKTLELTAERSDGTPSALPVTWSVDRGELGAIDAKSGKLTLTGAAGNITVTARSGTLHSSLTIAILVRVQQEGDPDSGKLAQGAGGLGGVGGEGGGSALPKGPLRAALDGAATEDSGLVWLYPYDGTVWPRGLPAPLIQWQHGTHAPLAVKLTIAVDDSFSAELYLGPPPQLAAMAPIDRLPIPQAIWRSALQSGKVMSVALTIAASDGAGGYTAYKAHSKLTWTIAPTTLKGVVYYNSYGTKLAENQSGAMGGGRFGGATLAIQRDVFDPALVAGTTTPDDSGCRVCHVVAANGSTLIVQRPNYTSSSLYDLRNKNQESMPTWAADGKFGWSALSADGSLALGNAGPPGSTTVTASSLATSGLYKVSDGTQLTARGLSELVTQAATPSFSPDTTKVAFNLFQGPGSPSIMADGRSIVVMDFKRVDDKTYEFSNAKAVYTSPQVDHKPCWPFFLPDNSGVVFELELNAANFGTWHGGRGELWWADLEGHTHALDAANGTGYLPQGAAQHDADATLQYEPTVAPIVAGGYAWVVFTSRRLYGNVATRGPFESDPREYDLTQTNSGGPTTKKLWVSAISLPAKSGTDPSHPAFYLPAQELYAGNSRGYWALEACKEEKASCTAGDECCGGYCQRDVEFDVGICTDVPPTTCSKEYDKCNVSADCCATSPVLSCIAGRCATVQLQ
jgi:hypothetical protein